ncbi:MAG: hypothetical protein IJ811_03015, partial [Clostridia bacterium]|nr:hypothetical protein [Clostridia bacterium]
LKSLVELGGFRTVEVVSVGKPLFTDYDGPAGFNMNSLSGNWGGKAPDTSQWTAFPSEDLMGCSWNKSMMLQMGLSMGAEAANTGCNGWYAPGVNLHRSAYNARNYEYYSEDGVLSGYLAANVIKGAKINGLYCYLKHFACSEEGPNPRNVNTWLTEQNLRENYLRPFEIAVKEGGANAIMSAFNRVGAVWSGANYAMLTQILREEWGFKGSVITDWTDGQGIGGMNSTQGVRAGNDLWLNPYNSLNSGMSMNATDIACAQRSAKNIIYTYVDTYTFAKNFDRSKLDSTLSFEVDLGSLKQTKDPFAWWNVVVFALDFLAVGGFALWAGFLFFPATDDGKLKKVGKMVKIAAIVILALTVVATSVVIPVGMASRAASSDQSANASDSSSNSGSKQTIDPNIQNIEISGNVVVTDGRPLTAASFTVNARYKDGSVKALSKKQYELVNGSEVATIGKAGKISVKYGDLIAEKAYTVQKTLEGEDALLTGKGKTGTEDEYQMIDGQLVPAGTTTGFAGDFKNGDTLTFTLNSTLSAKANLTFRVASGYCVYVNGSNSNDGYLMRELKLNAILDIYVNGVKISIPDTVVLPEVGPSSNYAGLYNVYSEVSFDDVNLSAGVNQIRLAFVSGRNGEKNCWGSAVSNINVDYMSVSSVGRAVDATATVTAIEIGDFTANIYDDYRAVNVPVLATMSNGEKMLLSSDEYDLTITGADTSATFFQGGNNYVTATLKGNSSITAQKTYVINAQKHIYIRTADVYEKDGRVYYAFSGVQYGYDNATFRFFSDEGDYNFAEITVTPTSISFTIDVTDLANGIIYPHISMDGVNYPNDDNANGDIKNMGLRFNDGTSVTVNGRTYTLTDKWGMPCMVISEE